MAQRIVVHVVRLNKLAYLHIAPSGIYAQIEETASLRKFTGLPTASTRH
jgi:hypothetical protein